MELISKSSLHRELYKMVEQARDDVNASEDKVAFIRANAYLDAYTKVMFLVADAPAVDAEQVRHGEWIGVSEPDGNDNVQCRCSECSAGDTHSKSMVVPYCWRCGAKMDGE